MIKASGKTGGNPLLVLGLSDRNLYHLAERRPILVSAEEMATMGLPKLEVIIMSGATEQMMISELEKTWGKPTDKPMRRMLSITCPNCGTTSHNPTDIAQGYCGNCHDWTRS